MIGATPTAWCRRDSKGGAMFLFARVKVTSARKAKTASPDCRPFASAKGPEGVALPLRVFSSQNSFFRCCSLGRIPPRYCACAYSIPPALAPRISAFLFEKIRRLLFSRPFTVYAQSPSPRKKLFFFEKNRLLLKAARVPTVSLPRLRLE